jgi:hypothetical protein
MTERQQLDQIKAAQARVGSRPSDVFVGQREWRFLTVAEIRYFVSIARRDEGMARPPLNADEQRELDLARKAVTTRYEGENADDFGVYGATGLTLKESQEMAALKARTGFLRATGGAAFSLVV